MPGTSDSRLKDVLVFLAQSLVDHPEQVRVREINGEGSVILELSVAQEDMGKVIGKQGRIARAIRTVTKALAVREGRRVVVEIVE